MCCACSIRFVGAFFRLFLSSCYHKLIEIVLNGLLNQLLFRLRNSSNSITWKCLRCAVLCCLHSVLITALFFVRFYLFIHNCTLLRYRSIMYILFFSAAFQLFRYYCIVGVIIVFFFVSAFRLFRSMHGTCRLSHSPSMLLIFIPMPAAFVLFYQFKTRCSTEQKKTENENISPTSAANDFAEDCSKRTLFIP